MSWKCILDVYCSVIALQDAQLGDWCLGTEKFCMQVTIKQRIPLDAYTLQEEEVSAVRYIHFKELESKYSNADPEMAMSLLGENAAVRATMIVIQLC